MEFNEVFRNLFKLFDADGSGTIEKDEMVSFVNTLLGKWWLKERIDDWKKFNNYKLIIVNN